MTGWAERRDRQRVRVALYKGEPVGEDDQELVRQVLARVRWAWPLALNWAVLGCVWLWLLVVAHGTLRWAGIFWLFASVMSVFGLLRQRKRIVSGASRLGFHLGG